MITLQYFLLVFSCLFFVIQAAKIDDEVPEHTRTFLYTRPMESYLFLDRAQTRTVNYKKGKIQGGLVIIGVFEESIQNTEPTHYFLTEDKEFFLVSGDNNTLYLDTRDIRAEWLGLDGNFLSSFTLQPIQRQTGAILEYTQQLSKFIEYSFFEDWYIRILTSVYSTKNHVQFAATNNKTPTLLRAFNNPGWDFGRISNESQKKSGIGKIELALGTRYEKDHFVVVYETILGLPTGNKQNAKKLFEPIVGNNGHAEIGARLGIDYEMTSPTSSFRAHFFLDLQGLLLVKNKQERTFDLKKKKWSRYLLFNTIDPEFSTSNLPGVNVLTRRVSVRPFVMADFTFGWTMSYRAFTWEIGYDIWGHHQERVDLQEPFARTFGIAGSRPGVTASRSDIARLAPDDEVFIPITVYDLDFRSAQAETALTHTIYLIAGTSRVTEQSEFLFSGLFFREFQQKKGALSKWGCAIKFMKSF